MFESKKRGFKVHLGDRIAMYVTDNRGQRDTFSYACSPENFESVIESIIDDYRLDGFKMRIFEDTIMFSNGVDVKTLYFYAKPVIIGETND